MPLLFKSNLPTTIYVYVYKTYLCLTLNSPMSARRKTQDDLESKFFAIHQSKLRLLQKRDSKA